MTTTAFFRTVTGLLIFTVSLPKRRITEFRKFSARTDLHTLIFVLLIFIQHEFIFGQTVIGGLTPDPSAMLDIQSTSKGVLFPRVPNRSSVASPATGLMIYNDDNGCLEINLGSPGSPNWQSIKCEVRCGAYVASGVWKRFMCHNLGAANFSSDPFTPSWENHGGYWQWGIADEAATGPSGTNGSTPNDAAPGVWNTTSALPGAWSDGSKKDEDPCPDGFRVPTKTQWEGVFNPSLNVVTDASGSTWASSPTNYTSGKNFGPSLMLPAAGFRIFISGALFSRGSNGYYWSSTESGTFNTWAWYLFFGSGGAGMLENESTFGYSVRCIAE